MIKFLKSNKFATILILLICLIFASNPQVYANSCLNGVSVWAIKIFPVLFPFFIFTRIIVNLSENKPNIMDKFFNKVYHTPVGSFKTFFLSVLSGYPMGAKLICTMYNENKINTIEAKKMLSFCSISGPMFMLGTVGIAILCSYKAGIIILVSNIIASLINGLIYRGKEKANLKLKYESKTKTFNLGEHVYDSLISIFMVGAYIILSYLIIDMLENLHIISFLSNTICGVFNGLINPDIVNSVICGVLEITRGIIELNATNVSLILKTILSSGLIGFGGISIMLQSNHFIANLGIKKRTIILQKLTQGLLCLLISTPLAILFL